MGIAGAERRALSDLFVELGPDVPTLCAGWQARDLAAHLVLRERRLDAAPGIMLPALARHTERVQAGYAARPWDELVQLVRTGPPAFSPMAIPVLNELVNSVEYFVHHEDVRRAQPGWQPRPADASRDAALWSALGRFGRMSHRRSPVGVRARRPDGAELLLKDGPDPVVLIGEPGELLLHASGRDAVRIEFDGTPEAITALGATHRGI